MGVTTTPRGTLKSVVVSRTPVRLIVICAVLMLAEGYDLFTYGVAVPALLVHPGWHLTPTYAGVIGSAGVVGMLVGSLLVGVLTDRFGRKAMFFGAVSFFSIGMLLCALAPTPESLLLARIVVGVGSGGFLPTGLAYVVEASPINRRAFNTAITTCAVAAGGALGAFIGVIVMPTLGYRFMFGFGALPLVLVLPIVALALPESVAWLVHKGRTERARELIGKYDLPYTVVETPLADTALADTALADDASAEAALADGAMAGPALADAALAAATPGRVGVSRSVTSLFRGSTLRATLVFWLGSAFCMMLIFGTNTWIPSFMLRSGFGLTSSIALLAALNAGVVVGTFIVASVADRTGPKMLILISFAACVVALVLLAQQPPVVITYLLVVVVGFGSGGTQNLINAYLAIYYQPHQRGTGIGAALGVGRLGGIVGPIFGGIIAASALGPAFNFYAFAVPAVLGFLVFIFAPKVSKVPFQSIDLSAH